MNSNDNCAGRWRNTTLKTSIRRRRIRIGLLYGGRNIINSNYHHYDYRHQIRSHNGLFITNKNNKESKQAILIPKTIINNKNILIENNLAINLRQGFMIIR